MNAERDRFIFMTKHCRVFFRRYVAGVVFSALIFSIMTYIMYEHMHNFFWLALALYIGITSLLFSFVGHLGNKYSNARSDSDLAFMRMRREDDYEDSYA